MPLNLDAPPRSYLNKDGVVSHSMPIPLGKGGGRRGRGRVVEQALTSQFLKYIEQLEASVTMELEIDSSETKRRRHRAKRAAQIKRKKIKLFLTMLSMTRQQEKRRIVKYRSCLDHAKRKKLVRRFERERQQAQANLVECAAKIGTVTSDQAKRRLRDRMMLGLEVLELEEHLMNCTKQRDSLMRLPPSVNRRDAYFEAWLALDKWLGAVVKSGKTANVPFFAKFAWLKPEKEVLAENKAHMRQLERKRSPTKRRGKKRKKKKSKKRKRKGGSESNLFPAVAGADSTDGVVATPSTPGGGSATGKTTPSSTSSGAGSGSRGGHKKNRSFAGPLATRRRNRLRQELPVFVLSDTFATKNNVVRDNQVQDPHLLHFADTKEVDYNVERMLTGCKLHTRDSLYAALLDLCEQLGAAIRMGRRVRLVFGIGTLSVSQLRRVDFAFGDHLSESAPCAIAMRQGAPMAHNGYERRYREGLRRLYIKYAPNKSDAQVRLVLEKYGHNTAKLSEAMQGKYGVRPEEFMPKTGDFIPAKRASELRPKTPVTKLMMEGQERYANEEYGESAAEYRKALNIVRERKRAQLKKLAVMQQGEGGKVPWKMSKHLERPAVQTLTL